MAFPRHPLPRPKRLQRETIAVESKRGIAAFLKACQRPLKISNVVFG